MSRESGYKQALMQHLRKNLPGFVLLRHEDRAMAGIPDIQVIGHGRSSWWEAKHATPDFENKMIQTVMMRRIIRAGLLARYIIWEEHHDIKRTFIVHPSLINKWTARPESFASGINHDLILEAIQKVHTNDPF